MLNKIKSNRSAPEGESCNPQLELVFASLFPTFPNHDLRNPTHLPKGIDHSWEVLTKIFNSSDKSFIICDKTAHLSCKNERCVCDLSCRNKQNEDLCRENEHLQVHEAHLVSKICSFVEWSKKLRSLM